MKVAFLVLTAVFSIIYASHVKAASCIDFNGKYSGIGTETDQAGYARTTSLDLSVTQAGCESLSIEEDRNEFVFRRAYVTDGKTHVREVRDLGKLAGYRHETATIDENGLSIQVMRTFEGTESVQTMTELWRFESAGTLAIEIQMLDGARGPIKTIYRLRRY